jgi:predicted DNA-binding protein with PD1-like motif
MESAAMAVRRVHVLRIDPGEDVLGSVRKFLKGSGVRQAVVLGGYGTLATHHLHWVRHNRLPPENHFEKGTGGIEILSMNGLVVEGEPHIHVTLSTPAGAYGGHLEPGCSAYVLCEVFFAEVEGVALSRRRTAVDVPGMGTGEVPRLTFGKA